MTDYLREMIKTSKSEPKELPDPAMKTPDNAIHELVIVGHAKD